MSFLLDKYYFDAVAPDGRCFIGYSALLRWGLLCLRYHGGIWMNARGEVRTTGRFFAFPQPVIEEDRLTWATPHGTGTWSGPSIDRALRLLDDKDGHVSWEPHQYRTAATIPEGPFGALTGTGYTERLRMDIPPWRLPIRALHWGRFHGGRNDLVWIRWEGPHPLLVLILNGEEVNGGSVAHDGVDANGHHLRFAEKRVLRDGTLRRNIFGNARWPGFLFPWRVLNMHEQKFVSRGELALPDGSTDHGWALHEIVGWP